MPDTETFEQSAAALRQAAEETGAYRIKLRVLRWMQKHRDELGENLKESLLKEIA